MKIKFLPLGTVVLLKGGRKRVMITGYGPIDGSGKVFDYTGCLYPEGVISSNETLLFNHEQLESLYFNGFFDNEAYEFLKVAQPLIEEARSKSDANQAQGQTATENVSQPTIMPETSVAQPAIVSPDVKPLETTIAPVNEVNNFVSDTVETVSTTAAPTPVVIPTTSLQPQTLSTPSVTE